MEFKFIPETKEVSFLLTDAGKDFEALVSPDCLEDNGLDAATGEQIIAWCKKNEHELVRAAKAHANNGYANSRFKNLVLKEIS